MATVIHLILSLKFYNHTLLNDTNKMHKHSLAFFAMTKTITLRLQEDKYKRFKQLAECDNRSISNFIENAALRFIEEEEYLDG
jgi:hypothetical protein